jgi:hypothetical protein
MDDTVKLLPRSQNPEAEPHYICVDGTEVPYIECWRVGFEPEGEDSLFSLTLDNRFGIDCTETELRKWIWFVANAMAVAAGRTSHGPNSNPRNPHGDPLAGYATERIEGTPV